MDQEQYMEEVESAIDEDIAEEMREDSMEDDMDMQREMDDPTGEGGQMVSENQGVLEFLEKILLGDNRFLTGNLTYEELGRPTFSTRFWLNLSNTCETLLGMPFVAKYCEKKARITTDTSLSRDGFMINTSVTQKKIREKKSSSDLAKFLTSKSK